MQQDSNQSNSQTETTYVKVIEISILKAIGIVAATILATLVTTLFVAIHTNIADHYALAQATNDIENLQSTTSKLTEIAEQFISLKNDLSNTNKNLINLQTDIRELREDINSK